MNQLDFDRISKALQSSYQALLSENDEASTIVNQLNQAQDEYLQALSHATEVEKEYLRYADFS